MITDRIGQQDVVLQINHNHYLKKTNTPRKNVSSRDNVFIKNSSILEIPQFFFG